MPSLTESLVDYIRARNTVETVPIRVIFFKGKTRFHWVNEVILLRVPKTATVADLRRMLDEKDHESHGKFYHAPKFTDDPDTDEAPFLEQNFLDEASVLVESNLSIDSAGVKTVYTHI